jgi:hypothetical protein
MAVTTTVVPSVLVKAAAMPTSMLRSSSFPLNFITMFAFSS